MNLFSRILILFLIFLASRSWAALPPGVLSINSLMEQWRSELTIRIEGLQENYVLRRESNLLSYTSHKGEKCSYVWVAAHQPLAQAQLDAFDSQGGKTQIARYTGCDKRTNINETHFSQGSSPYVLSMDSFRTGQRSFELQEGETSRDYYLADEFGTEMFRLYGMRTATGLFYSLSLFGQNFLTYEISKEAQFDRYTFNFKPVKIKYVRKFRTWDADYNFPEFTMHVYQFKNGHRNNEVQYVTTDNQQLSQQAFQQMFAGIVISGPLNTLKSVMEYHLFSFPSIEIGSTGAQNQRILEELNLAQIRLRSGTQQDIELVLQLLREYVNAINNNQIRINDQRPEN